MGLLFKTSLIHIKKNFFVTSVLSFFVGLSVVVLSSSDHLSKNLQQGFREINYDGNAHDMILSVKQFRPTQNVDLNVSYATDKSNLNITPRWSYRWSWDSLKNEFWVKTSDYIKVVDNNTDSSSSSSEKFKHVPDVVFSIPTNPREIILECSSAGSFLKNSDADISFLDRNDAIIDWQNIDRDFSPKYIKTCGSDKYNLDHFRDSFSSFFDSINKYFSTIFDSKPEFSDEEKIAIHKLTKSLNPKSFWMQKIKDANIFMNLWEKDVYFEVEIPFNVKFKNDSSANQLFETLVHNVRDDAEIFYQLDDSFRRKINYFGDSKRFKKIPIKYWMSTIAKNLESSISSISLPSIPSLNYIETLFILVKLIMWEYINKDSSADELFKTSANYYSEFKKEKLLKTVESWNEINDDSSITKHDPFKKYESKIDSPYSKSEEYIFSTIASSKKISELDSTKSSDDQTLLQFVKNTFKKWINKDNSSSISSIDKENKSTSSQPTSFDETVNKIMEKIKSSFVSYFSVLNLKNTQVAKQLIDESGIFTLSFILQNFKYPIFNFDADKKRNKSRKKNKDVLPSINYHKSIVVANADKPAKLNDFTNSTIGHSYKIVTQERTGNAYINRLKILSGNPLIKSLEHFTDILSFKDYQGSIYKMNDFLRVMSRMKYLDKKMEESIRKLYKYNSYKYDEKWTSDAWFDSWNQQSLWKMIFNKSTVVRQGSRVYLNLIYGKIYNFTKIFETYIAIDERHNPYIDQFSSYFAVVSPIYAQNNGIKPISDNQYMKFKKLVEDPHTTQEQWDKEYHSFILNPQNYDHIINVNGNKLIVTGIGLTPDMIFPSHTYLNLISNKNTEGILFVDKYGYENIKSNSPSKWDEQYLSISYPQAVKDSHLEDDYKNKMEGHIRKYLPSSEDLFDLQLVKDAPILNQLVFLRSQYPYRFLDAIHIIVGFILSFVGIVVLFTVWVLIKRYVISSLKTFGVFVANGIYRNKIILNSSIFVLVPIVLGAVIGYLISLALQPLVFGMVANIWYLTPVFNGFNISSLLYYIFIVIMVLVPISWITSFFLLRNDVNKLMKSSSSFKQNKLIKFVGQHFHRLSSLWKFRISVIINTIGRGFVLSSETILLFVFMNFLFNNLNQFQTISDLELQTKSYGWNIPYGTPSEQSRMPVLTSYVNLGDTYLDKTPHDKVFYIKNSDKWDKKQIQFSEETPEIIGSGLKSVYSISQLNEYFKKCKDQDPKKWYSDLGIMDFDYVSNTLDEENSYNKYLVSYNWTQNGGDEQQNECSSFNYKPEKIEFPKHSKASDSVWYSSTKISSKNEKFNPDTTNENQLGNLRDYVPVKDENRKKSEGYQMIEFQNKQNNQKEPLFKPLMEYYRKKDPLISDKKSDDNEFVSYSFIGSPDANETELNETSTKIKGDFMIFSDGNKLPTLSRLYRDHSNYWLLTLYDFLYFEQNPLILKNKVVLPFILDYPFSIEFSGNKKTDNPWLRFSNFLSSYSPELLAYMNRNNLNFINEIIKSRYGAFFVNRFMTKHAITELPKDHNPGKLISNKKSWLVKKEIVAEGNKEEITEGLYWIDPNKLLYQHDILSSNRFFIFRPDFLYLFYALMKDPAFQTKEIAPTKIAFNQHIYVPDYDKPFEEWSISGNLATDKGKNKGLTSSHDNPKYSDSPNGDQTYTSLNATIDPDISIDIFGLKQDGRGSYVKLKKGNSVINDKLYLKLESDDVYPIIVNQFTAKYMNLSIGSTLNIKVSNTFDRYTPKKNKQQKNVVLKVVDIYDSYYKNSIYISQENANKILGLHPDYGYNGIFTKNTTTDDLPFQLVKALFARSDSGIYAYTSFNKNSFESKNFLDSKPDISSQVSSDNPLIPPTNNIFMQLKLGIRGEGDSFLSSDDFLDNYLAIYKSGTPFDATYANLDPNTTKNFVFSTISDLVISIVNLFITIFTPLLVFSLLVITNLIIEDLRNLLTILNMLGFTYSENANTILMYLGLILVFSFILGLPFSSVLLKAYVSGMLNSLSMYLPIYLRLDYLAASLGIIFLMFGFSYYMSMRKTKSMYLPLEMKSLG